MTKIQKWIFNKIEASENDLSQPSSSIPKKSNGSKKDVPSTTGAGKKPSNDLRSDEKKEATKKKAKKIIILLIILAIIGSIIGVIIYFAVAPQYKHITVDSISIDDSKDEITFHDGKNDYTVNENDFGTAYYTSAAIGTNREVIIGDIEFEIGYEPIDGNTTIGNAKFTQHYDDATKTNTYSDIENIHGKGQVATATELDALSSWRKSVWSISTNPPQPFPWTSLLSLLLPILLIIVMIVFYRKMMKAQMGSGADSVFGMGKSQAKMAKSNVKFEDVAGIEEEKSELIEIVDYLKRPEKYTVMGARTPKGVMLYGPPGTGKTLLARAVAGEAGVPFFQISGSAFEDMLVGVGAKRVRDLFQKARKASPAIIFIDEIDSVAGKRGKNDVMGGGGLQDQTINQLLAEMDGFDTSTGVVVMAATNRLDVLDEAILRPGRFDRNIQINLPDIKERDAILRIHTRNKNLSSKVELEDIARRTPGFSGAQLENVLNEATLMAVRRDSTSISMDDIDEAIDRVIAGPAKKSKAITPEEKKQIAYHEAGHALIGLHTKGADVVQKITIIPRGMAAGYTLQTPEKQELSIQKKSDLLGMIRATLGGRASEEVIYGKDSVSTGASNDLYKVTNIVRSMVMQLGMSPLGMTQFVPSEGSVNPYSQKLYSETTALAIDKEIDKIISTEYSNAIAIIKEHRKELELLVETLLILETIVKKQIDYIHENIALPSEVISKKKELEEHAKKLKKEKALKAKENKSDKSKKV